MTWNYRVVRHAIDDTGETYLAIHEHYTGGLFKAPGAITHDPVQVSSSEDEGGALDELRVQLERMMTALYKPILDAKDFEQKEKQP